jgi:hypothetical protein
MTMFTKTDYDVGTAAALTAIRNAVNQLPGFERAMIPAAKEPAAAAAISKCVLDAVAAAHPTAPATDKP